MEKIKILHIASFYGNIGDNANHNGLRMNLRKIFKDNLVFDELEIREFYQSRNERDFNSNEFIALCNSYELIIIGGGNFFELKWDYSYTGTTVNIDEETLSKINKPILFFGLGCDIGKGCNKNTITKFDAFLQRITMSSQFFVTVRNDGSSQTINQLYGGKYDDEILKVADGGFFIQTDKVSLPIQKSGKKIIGINVACDMKEIRFSEEVSYDDFIEKFAETIDTFLLKNNDYELIFFPHIYSDLKAISDVLRNIEDKNRRNKVIVAPYLSGEDADRYIFGLYKECELILGMRFHSNVCAIAQNIPTIALSSYKKIPDLLSELELPDRVIHINIKDFEQKLLTQINYTLKNRDMIKELYKKVNKKIVAENNLFMKKLKIWLIKNDFRVK